MASTYPDTAPPKRRWVLRVAHPGPIGAFLRGALSGAVGVLALALVLPGGGPAGAALAVSVFLAGSGIALRALKRGFPHPELGLCNLLTLARLGLACTLLAPLLAGAVPSWPVFALAALALSLDGFDGWLARRQQRASDFGARFDVEVDSLLALVLAVCAAMGTGIGVWAVFLGLPRYAFLAAGAVLPWMRRPLPERFSRKAVCVIQIGVLIALQAPVLPPIAAILSGVAALLALAWSFAVDINWLWARRG
ncbi:CDP-alcohol phosphatidyltransferase [Thalassococcus profundi]|uniref:CDP-alcohol phosphatidyltransferase n=1 Tax=Thalassococcus profundi TaxID=2282382 RepID=A0A369TLW2_9RHOB|nr:CDP-alcohol phosphatidyltransferase [Thalassococcus profundi]